MYLLALVLSFQAGIAYAQDSQTMRWPLYLLALVLSFQAGIAYAQDSQTQSGLAQRVQNLMSIEVGFEQMVPPGMSIEAKEVSRQGTPGKNPVVRYP
jgi:hypothetical protein